MRWSKLKGQMWGGATLPMLHEGHYYNTDMKVGVMSPSGRSYHALVKVERSDVGRGHIDDAT